MLKAEAIDHYGTATKVAEVLGIGKALVSKWDEIPPRYQYELERLSDGALVAEWPPADRPNMVVPPPKAQRRGERRARAN